MHAKQPWIDDKELQVIEEIKKGVSRQTLVAGLVTAGTSALVVMLATTAVASVALSQSFQNAGFVNQLSKNVSVALETQADTDVKMEHTLNPFYDGLQCLGDELQSLKPEHS